MHLLWAFMRLSLLGSAYIMENATGGVETHNGGRQLPKFPPGWEWQRGALVEYPRQMEQGDATLVTISGLFSIRGFYFFFMALLILFNIFCLFSPFLCP